MGVKNMIKKAAAKAGDAVAKVSVLSPEQVENIQLARENYLLEEPDPTDDVARVRTERMWQRVVLRYLMLFFHS